MTSNSLIAGALYVVATPIGHLDDVTLRALATLKTASYILAEDTRHTRVLLSHYRISTPLVPLHRLNETKACTWIVEQLSTGASLALVSDAGTPVVSDPGARIIQFLQDHNHRIIPVPGANAAVTALSAAGLQGDCFVFEGFLPAKALARRNHLRSLQAETRTLIFYEAPHRILGMLNDLIDVFGETHEAVLARELTKQFESIKRGPLLSLKQWTESDAYGQKGEFVVLLKGRERQPGDGVLLELTQLLTPLLATLPLKQSVALVTEMTDLPRNEVYQKALALKAQSGDQNE